MPRFGSSRKLPYELPVRLRGLRQFDRETVPYGAFDRETRRIDYSSDFFDAPTRKRRKSSRSSSKAKKSSKRRPLRHGDTVYCVFAGKKKISCSRSKARANAIADREKLKRAKKTGVRVKKTKWELRCPPGTKRVCKERKKGSRACKRMGCSKR